MKSYLSLIEINLKLAMRERVVLFFNFVFPLIFFFVFEQMMDASMGGVGLPMGLSFGLSLFVFGLYEAGTVVEQPLKEAIDLVPLEASGFELSDDLSNLVDDPDSSVPVFLSPKAVKRV